MSERTSSTECIERRGFLSAVAVGLGGLDASRQSTARMPDPGSYVIEQGDRCVPVTPLSGDETVEEFYDYRTPFTDPSGSAYSSYGTTDLQRPETSLLFLYDGPEGLSLVVVHDALDDGTNGGSVTFRFEGLAGGEWVVGDDIYDGSTNYDRFQQTDSGWRVDWTWGNGRTDGGVYHPLDDDFTVTVRPGFNGDAAIYGEYYEGEVSDWQVLSGDRDDPDRISLSLADPLTIRSGECRGSRRIGDDGDEEESTGEDENDDDDRAERSEPLRIDVSVAQGRVNPRSQGMLPVVVRSTDDFDATTLDPSTVAFGPDEATPAKWRRTDVTDDDRTDLLFHVRLSATGIDWSTDGATLTGETREGTAVEGTAELRLVPREGDEDDEDEDGEKDDKAEDEVEDDARNDDGGEYEDAEDDDEAEDDDRDDNDGGSRRADGGGHEEDDGGPGRGNGRGRGWGRNNGGGEGRGRDDNPGKGGRGKGGN